MAKLHSQTLIVTVSKMTKSTESVELITDETLAQLEVIMGELIGDKDHTLIEIQVDK